MTSEPRSVDDYVANRPGDKRAALEELRQIVRDPVPDAAERISYAQPTWSIKDVMARLWAWQQLSIARLEAAFHHREPQFSMWPDELEPEAEEHLEQINTWIYQANRDRPWPEVYRTWKEGCLCFLKLAEAVPEKDLLDPNRYPWLDGHPFYAVLAGSYEYHPSGVESTLLHRFADKKTQDSRQKGEE